jgi:hypothetical protein
MQLGSRVLMHTHVFPRHMMPESLWYTRRAGRQYHHDLQDMWTCYYSVAPALLTTHKAHLQCERNPTGWRYTADRARRGRTRGQDALHATKDNIC